MQSNRSALFRGRHFAEEIIVLCVRWYLRFSLSYRDLEELMTERGLSVDHTTVWHWVQHYAPELDRRVQHELKRTGTPWRVDEIYVHAAGRCTLVAPHSTSISPRSGMPGLASNSSARCWLRRIILARASSIWAVIPPIPTQ